MTQIVITGIDTDIGKTIATGMMARFLKQRQKSVITQKMVQTGCEKISEDILVHRKLMGQELLPEDHSGLTCPYLFRHPASPHLAARMEGRKIDPSRIHSAALELSQAFPIVLMEAAGGLFVPLTEDLLIIDFIARHGHPVILVSSSRLGSINHTLLSIEALKTRNIPLAGVVYNRDTAEEDPAIAEDSMDQIARFMTASGYPDCIVQMGVINPESPADINFDLIFRQF